MTSDQVKVSYCPVCGGSIQVASDDVEGGIVGWCDECHLVCGMAFSTTKDIITIALNVEHTLYPFLSGS